MIRHLLKLVWHRKRANALVMAEIFLSFLIVFAVVTMTVSLLSRWSAPLGFQWKDVWMVEINAVMPAESSGTSLGPPPKEAMSEAGRIAVAAGRMVRELETYREVESAAAESMTPYTGNTWTTMVGIEGREVLLTGDQAGDDFARVMRIPILQGRWFSKEDEGQNYLPLVVDSDAAEAMFGKGQSVLGRKFSAKNFAPEASGVADFRVVGVIAPYRKDGEFSDTGLKMIFLRASFVHPIPPDTGRIVVRVRPGTPASFEAELNDRLRHVGGASFRIQRMEDMRHAALRARFIPVAILTLVALFLIAMVALGLTGVLWQTVTRRMREIGLRRAVGASGPGVRSQLLGEVTILSTLSVILGAIVIVQLPLLGLFRVVTPPEFAAGFFVALVVIYSITLLCGAYPSWLASTIEPADALRYE
jgi:putative ABC transport system permease protein